MWLIKDYFYDFLNLYRKNEKELGFCLTETSRLPFSSLSSSCFSGGRLSLPPPGEALVFPACFSSRISLFSFVFLFIFAGKIALFCWVFIVCRYGVVSNVKHRSLQRDMCLLASLSDLGLLLLFPSRGYDQGGRSALDIFLCACWRLRWWDSGVRSAVVSSSVVVV